MSLRVLVIGAGLAGLAAADRLLDAGASVVVIDSFPVPGGRTANFDVPVPVAGLWPGDVVEHGLHAWFQHYHALYALMARAGVSKPPFAGQGVYLFNPRDGHVAIEGGPLFWLVNALRLPEALRGERKGALAAFARLIRMLPRALAHPEETDRRSAAELLGEAGVPNEAVETVFGPCLYSLTSLPMDELSGLEMLRWMSSILPDPRIRCLPGGGTDAMCAPIAAHLRSRGADFRFGVEVRRLWLDGERRVRLELDKAPDRTGLRHVLVSGFEPDEPPDPSSADAVVCTLPWERLADVSRDDAALSEHPVWMKLSGLENIHPLTIRLWFERPIQGAEERYILSKGTLFDVLRPTREPARYEGIRLIDALVENVNTHLPEIGYRHEQYIAPGPLQASIVERVLADLERMYEGQVRDNPVLRSFVHTREGIVACRPGAWANRAPQDVGLPNLFLAGDWTQQGWGVCMEGAVRSGQLAVEALLSGRRRPMAIRPPAFGQVAYSMKSFFVRS